MGLTLGFHLVPDTREAKFMIKDPLAKAGCCVIA